MSPDTKPLELGPGRIVMGVDTGTRRARVVACLVTSASIVLLPSATATYTMPMPTGSSLTGSSLTGTVTLTDEGARLTRELCEQLAAERAAEEPQKKVSYQKQQRALPKFLRKRGRS